MQSMYIVDTETIKKNLILHCRVMVLEERPVIMVWFVLSAAYRVLFRGMMDSLDVGGEDNIKMDLQEVAWVDLEWIDMVEDRDR